MFDLNGFDVVWMFLVHQPFQKYDGIWSLFYLLQSAQNVYLGNAWILYWKGNVPRNFQESFSCTINSYKALHIFLSVPVLLFVVRGSRSLFLFSWFQKELLASLMPPISLQFRKSRLLDVSISHRCKWSLKMIDHNVHLCRNRKNNFTFLFFFCFFC